MGLTELAMGIVGGAVFTGTGLWMLIWPENYREMELRYLAKQRRRFGYFPGLNSRQRQAESAFFPIAASVFGTVCLAAGLSLFVVIGIQL